LAMDILLDDFLELAIDMGLLDLLDLLLSSEENTLERSERLIGLILLAGERKLEWRLCLGLRKDDIAGRRLLLESAKSANSCMTQLSCTSSLLDK
jgi:hypothetical protein